MGIAGDLVICPLVLNLFPLCHWLSHRERRQKNHVKNSRPQRKSSRPSRAVLHLDLEVKNVLWNNKDSRCSTSDSSNKSHVTWKFSGPFKPTQGQNTMEKKMYWKYHTFWTVLNMQRQGVFVLMYGTMWSTKSWFTNQTSTCFEKVLFHCLKAQLVRGFNTLKLN